MRPSRIYSCTCTPTSVSCPFAFFFALDRPRPLLPLVMLLSSFQSPEIPRLSPCGSSDMPSKSWGVRVDVLVSWLASQAGHDEQKARPTAVQPAQQQCRVWENPSLDFSFFPYLAPFCSVRTSSFHTTQFGHHFLHVFGVGFQLSPLGLLRHVRCVYTCKQGKRAGYLHIIHMQVGGR